MKFFRDIAREFEHVLGMQESRWIGRALPVVVLLCSLALTYQLWKSEQLNAIRDLQTDFDYRIRETNGRIDQRMKAYEQILRGVRSLFAADMDEVDRARFHDYIASLHLEDNYPGAQAIGFLQLVPAARKDSHISSVRRQGFPQYDIFPAGARQFYAPTLYVESLAGVSRQALGWDAYTDPVRRAAMEKSRDSGKVTISGKISLPLQKNEDATVQRGFVMFLPVYREGMRRTTLTERRANIAGWIYASFRMVDMMNDILGEVATEVDIEVHDGVLLSDETMMYDPDLSGSGGNPNAWFKNTTRIEVANHYWTVVMRSLYGFESRMDRRKSGITAVTGTVASLLLALFVWLLLLARTQALQAARKINQELSERKKAEEGLRLAATVVNTVEEAVVVTGPDNNIIAVNPAFTVITGYTPEEAIGRNPRILSSGRHTQEFYRELWQTLLAKGSWHGEIWDKRKNGEIYIKWLSVRLVRDESGALTHHIGVFSDISERKSAEEKIKQLAYFDTLTTLPNRTLFGDRLQQAITRAQRDKGHFSLMFLDLDRFKHINDTLGHDFGDWMLKESAQRLLEAVRASDTISRIGGDEFVVLLPNTETEKDALGVAEKILHALGQPFERAGHSLRISASIGIAIYPQHGRDGRTLIKNADAAMYSAKGRGRNNATCFRPASGEGDPG
jgi:diguanylate cyclase (GGDEF)-like protein/PAS domain S-box-containing protein